MVKLADGTEVQPSELWDGEKLAYYTIPMAEFQAKMGIQHRIMDIGMDAYGAFITFTVSTLHFAE